MDIPSRIRILGGIQQGSVFYFQEEQLTSPEPHYFVVLNRSPKTEELIIMACASSQIAKRKNIVDKLGFAPETLVFISKEDYPLLTKETVIDCNKVFNKNLQSLSDMLDQNKLGVCIEVLPKNIVDKLISGVMLSTQISEDIKNILHTRD
jgi:hypothetical protein